MGVQYYMQQVGGQPKLLVIRFSASAQYSVRDSCLFFEPKETEFDLGWVKISCRVLQKILIAQIPHY